MLVMRKEATRNPEVYVSGNAVRYRSFLVVMNPVGWMLRALLVVILERMTESSLQEIQKISDSSAVTAPCWAAEEYVIATECSACTNFQHKTVRECSVTGYIENVNCAGSKKEETKSCRSSMREKTTFWQFVGSMMAASAVVSLVVVCRQRTLDMRALEKVRKQIESI